MIKKPFFLVDQEQNYNLCVIIVNYRTAALTIDCLKSLEKEIESLPSIKVVVVDNNSGDDSVNLIQNAIDSHNWQDWANLISSPINGGFAYGNNLVLRPMLESDTLPPYVLLLNPDTIIRENAITTLLEFMNTNSEVGIAGSRLENLDGTPQHSAFRFRTLLSELDSGLRLGLVSQILANWIVAPPIPEENCPTDWVAGASMIIRREVFKDIGLLDEGYFMYCEEMDYCLQAKKAGWNCWYVPNSRVVHFVGQSSGIDIRDPQPKRRPQYWFDSRRRYFLKNYGWFYTVLTDLIWMISFILWKIRQYIQRKPNNDPPYLLRDFFCNSALFHPFFCHPLWFNRWENRGLFEQIKEDWIAHGKDWTKPGFRAVAVHRFGVWRMGIEPKILRAPFSILYRMLFRKIRNNYGIELPYTVQLGRRVVIEHQSAIVIHGNAIIGDDCIIRQGVTIGNRYLDRPLEAPQFGKKVNVGADAKIFGNVKIGDNVNIGANAVILQDIPENSTAVGIPARIITNSESSI
jgi:GT2 family glycosyltransferase/serine acetyltransferase